MLDVQQYLWDGKTLEDLVEEYSIQIVRHPTNRLLILNYHQKDSQPKDNPIICDCRGLVLEDKSFILIGRAFKRFFNLGELAHKPNQFNWDNFHTYEKCDGSLMLLFNYLGEWKVNTRGSFGKGLVGESGKTWEQLFYSVFSSTKLSLLDKNCTYVFEFVSPHNKVVREYGKTDLYLLSVFSYEAEMPPIYVDKIADQIDIKRPFRFDFDNLNDIRIYLKDLESSNPTFEGCVLCDDKFNRIKAKNKSWQDYHRLKDNGSVFLMKRLVPILLRGGKDNLLCAFNEQASLINDVDAKLKETLVQLQMTFSAVQLIRNQKDFALAIADHPLKSIMFSARSSQRPIEEQWLHSENIILNQVFGE